MRPDAKPFRRPALLAGLIVLVALPAAADGKVRGLVIDNGTVQFNGITTAPRERKEPLQNGGYPLHDRSTSAAIPKPQSQREVIVEMEQLYDQPAIPVPRPSPPCAPSSCGD
jgi:hypothetical protein